MAGSRSSSLHAHAWARACSKTSVGWAPENAVAPVEDEEGDARDAEHLGGRLVAADVVAVVVRFQHVPHGLGVEPDLGGEGDQGLAVADGGPSVK